MTDGKIIRRLTAIMAADMVGYSRLVGIDEAGTVRRQQVHRSEIILPKIAEHDGRLVKTTGDGWLVEFGSAVDAVQCAVEIQEAISEHEGASPEDLRIAYRIGINQGDVIIEDDDILGDGVNIAARLEALADPGGICISEGVFQNVRGKLKLGFADLGPQRVKNIDKPVAAYRVLMDAGSEGRLEVARRPKKAMTVLAVAALVLLGAGVFLWQPWAPDVAPARAGKFAFPLPKKPSIAVLPFDNLSGDPRQDYLGDSIARNIIGSLSKISQILVIARKSTVVYKGKAVRQTAEALGVRYVLKGSVQKTDKRVRVTAQLIDALTGHYIWSERYDRRVADFFAVLDDITREIVITLHVKFTEGENARVRHRSTNNLQAWEHAANGYAHFERFTKEDLARARELFIRAVQLDPKYTWAWAKIGLTHLNDARMGFSKDPEASLKKSIEIANKALALDDRIADVHLLRALIRLRQRRYEDALISARKAVTLDPNYPQARAALAMVAAGFGQWDEVISTTKVAIRLHPHHPSWYFFRIGRAYVFKGQYDLAVAITMKALGRAESDGLKSMFHTTLAFAHSEAGRLEVARKHMESALRINPRIGQLVRSVSNFKNPAHRERMLSALQKAGLPD